MIFDTLKNLSVYRGIYPNLDTVIDYLENHDISGLETGQYEIKGTEIYMNVIEGKLMEEEEGRYELHQKYLDLHIDLEGSEQVQFTDYDEEKLVKEYDEDGDFALLEGKAKASVLLDEGHFVICMLGEPHMPCVETDGHRIVKKAIIKILAV